MGVYGISNDYSVLRTIAEIANSAKFNFETLMNKGFPGLTGKGIEIL